MTVFLAIPCLLFGLLAMIFMLILLSGDRLPHLKTVIVAALISLLGTVGTIGGLLFNILLEPNSPWSQPNLILFLLIGSALFYFVAGYFRVRDVRGYLRRKEDIQKA